MVTSEKELKRNRLDGKYNLRKLSITEPIIILLLLLMIIIIAFINYKVSFIYNNNNLDFNFWTRINYFYFKYHIFVIPTLIIIYILTLIEGVNIFFLKKNILKKDRENMHPSVKRIAHHDFKEKMNDPKKKKQLKIDLFNAQLQIFRLLRKIIKLGKSYILYRVYGGLSNEYNHDSVWKLPTSKWHFLITSEFLCLKLKPINQEVINFNSTKITNKVSLYSILKSNLKKDIPYKQYLEFLFKPPTYTLVTELQETNKKDISKLISSFYIDEKKIKKHYKDNLIIIVDLYRDFYLKSSKPIKFLLLSLISYAENLDFEDNPLGLIWVDYLNRNFQEGSPAHYKKAKKFENKYLNETQNGYSTKKLYEIYSSIKKNNNGELIEFFFTNPKRQKQLYRETLTQLGKIYKVAPNRAVKLFLDKKLMGHKSYQSAFISLYKYAKSNYRHKIIPNNWYLWVKTINRSIYRCMVDCDADSCYPDSLIYFLIYDFEVSKIPANLKIKYQTSKEFKGVWFEAILNILINRYKSELNKLSFVVKSCNFDADSLNMTIQDNIIPLRITKKDN